MRHALSVTMVVVVTILSCSVLLIADGVSADTEYEVDGKVVGYDGNPLGGVTVTIDEGGTENRTATTDSSGIFKVTGLTGVTNLKILFYDSGKTVTAVPAIMSASNGWYKLDLSTVTPVGDVYDITSHTVTMMKTYLVGYITDEGSSASTPMANCDVIMTDNITEAAVHTVSTDKNGMFTVPINSTYGLKMAINASGYTPVPGLIFMDPVTQGGVTYLVFDLNGTIPSLGVTYHIPYTDEDGVRTYTIAAAYPILMSASVGDLTTYIYDTLGNPLRSAEITLTATIDGVVKKYTGTSDNSGCVTIKGMTTGEYKMTVKVNGFRDVEDINVTIGKGSNVIGDTIMSEKSAQEYLGLSLRHLMTVVGVIAGIIIVIILFVAVVRHKNAIDLDD